MPRLQQRSVPPAIVARLAEAGVDPVLARIFAARGIEATTELDTGLQTLLPFTLLAHAEDMASVLADAIAADRRLLIVGDYDADGATASAVGALALRRFGARVETLVPNRFEFGYGLTPEIVRIAAESSPDFIITVDNGIASLEGVREASRLGIPVLVTDHHLPGPELPDALAIVNPNQPDCGFPSKHLAGVGVMFYVMLALRAELRKRGAFARREEPNLADLLDLVALGTVADVVRLDRNNRVLVTQGLRRMRAGRTRPGIQALARVAGRPLASATCHDLGFVLGPRLNAAGRMEDMAQGIECLITNDADHALALAGQLDGLNRERREVEADMQAAALDAIGAAPPRGRASLVMFDEGWHPGVVGLLASRLRERFHVPTVCFAPGPDGEIKGSGRSIRALHLRDALDLVDRRHPGLIVRFGGHAAAAGVGIRAADFDRFRGAFDDTVAALLSPADLEQVIETDGELGPDSLTLALAEQLREQVWGQGFAAPVFAGDFRVRTQRLVGGAHTRLELVPAGDGRSAPLTAMLFRHAEPVPERIRAAYRLEVNEWNGARSVQLTLEHWEPS
ncbi:MAG: single-stranded-DNA-specific exonuclease RecJ [Betaproteobacteria bacterium]|nr:single-stranded-DNA-specific exonuclease RecJ [Betaproteobacteria bacterium]